MNSKAKNDFIKKHKNLFWYTPEEEKLNISDELLLETILNYEDISAIKELISILGMNESARIFRNMQGRKKLNIYPEIYNLFSIYFDKHAQRST